MANLDSILPELLEIILGFCSLQDVIHSSFVCRRLYTIIRDSLALQYHIKLLGACLDEHLFYSPIPLSERIALLDARESSWRELNFASSECIPIPDIDIGIRFPIAGSIVIATWGSYCASISMSLDDKKAYDPERLDIGEDMSIVGIGFSEEQDLVVPIYIPNVVPTPFIEMRFFKRSTCDLHPDALAPTIRLTRHHDNAVSFFSNDPFRHNNPVSCLDICDDKLIFIVSHGSPMAAEGAQSEGVYCVFWKTGRLVFLRKVAPYHHFDITFLDKFTVLLAGRQQGDLQLELCHLSSNHQDTTLRTLCFLSLPRVAPETRLLYMSARASPDPPSSHRSASSNTMFSCTPSSAVLSVKLILTQPAALVHVRLFEWIVHRAALLQLATRHRANELTQSQVTHGCPLTPDTTVSYPSSTVIIDPTIRDFHFDSLAPVYSWTEWNGPDITRWFEVPILSGDRLRSATIGQRLVSVTRAGAQSQVLTVADFNPYSVRRTRKASLETAAAIPPLHAEDSTLNSAAVTAVIESSTTLRSIGYFESDVVSSLPYVGTIVPAPDSFGDVLVDEEHIISVKSDHFEVFFVGAPRGELPH